MYCYCRTSLFINLFLVRNSFHNPQQIGHMLILHNREEEVSEGGEWAAVLPEEVTMALPELRLRGFSSLQAHSCCYKMKYSRWWYKDLLSIYPSIKAFYIRWFATLNHPWFCGNRFCSPSCPCWRFNTILFVLCYCGLISQFRHDDVSAPYVWYTGETVWWEGALSPRDNPIGFCLCVHHTAFTRNPLGKMWRVVIQGLEMDGVFLIASTAC